MSQPSALVVDAVASAEFVSKLHAETNGFPEVRALPSKDRVFTQDAEERRAFIRKHQEEDLLYGVASRDGVGGTKKNCIQLPCLWADVDSFGEYPDAYSFVDSRCRRLPSLIVGSGGGAHLLFLLDSPVDAHDPRVESTLRGLARTFSADSAAAEVARCLRLPGSWNRKYSPPRQARVIWPEWDRRYTLEEIMDLCAAPPAPDPSAKVSEGHRHTFLLREAGRLRRLGASPAALELELLALNAKCCFPLLPETEVKAIAQDIGAKPCPLLDSTQDGLAVAFIDKYLDNLRYTAVWHKWHMWDGTRWKEDMTVHVFDLARQLCREATKTDPERAKTLKSASTVASVVTLATSDQRSAMVPEAWDADVFLLNTPGGVVDLRTGEMKSHDPSSFITKITAVAPGGDCPLWRKELELVTRGDADLAGYLQRLSGYSLTGTIREEMLPFVYGCGKNGKDTICTTVQLIAGDYARSAPMSAFMASKNEQHPTDLAGLHRSRLVIASETSEGKRWDEAKIKLLTGGGVVSARFMRADFFDFVPQFKVWVLGNHKPTLRHVDTAMRRRLHLVPFLAEISPVDTSFKDKLRAEWPGILAWAIEGAVMWRRRGLDPPKAVVSASEEYFSDQDAVGRWLEERCELDPNAETSSRELYGDWKLWTESGKEYTGSQRSFVQGLQEHGLRKKREGGTGRVVFAGLRVRM